MRLSRSVLLSCSLVFVSPVLAQEVDPGGQLYDIRQQLADSCGDPDEADPAEAESILSCQEQTLEDMAAALDLSQGVVTTLMNEIQVQQAFLDGLDEGASTCESGSEEDGEDRYGPGGGGNTVTLCLVPPRRSMKPVSLDVPPWAADALLEAGGVEGPCRRGMGRRGGESDVSSRFGGGKGRGGNGQSQGLGPKKKQGSKGVKPTDKPGKKGGKKSNSAGKPAGEKKGAKNRTSPKSSSSGQRR